MTVLRNALFPLNQPGNIGGVYGEAKLAIFFVDVLMLLAWGERE